MPAVVRYHEVKAPMGKTFPDAGAAPADDGWVDSPRKFSGLHLQDAQAAAELKRQLKRVIQSYSELSQALEIWMTCSREEKETAEDQLREVAAGFVVLIDSGAAPAPEPAPPGAGPLPDDHPNIDSFMTGYVDAGSLRKGHYAGDEKDRTKLLKIGVQQYAATKHEEDLDGRQSLEKMLERVHELDEEAAEQALSEEETL